MNKRQLSGDQGAGLQYAQGGFVSIIVTMTIMIILSLITIGFARIMQREARQALDRQLSTQAFYAAEAGVNDALAIARKFPDVSKTTCDNPPTGPYAALNPSIDGTTVAYTCLLVDPTPGTLVYDQIDINRSTVTKVQADTGNINRLNVAWQSTDTANINRFHNDPQHKLPVAGNTGWNADTGILRMSIFPVELVGGVPQPRDRATLNAMARTYFFYPTAGGVPQVNTVDWNDTTQNGSFVDGNCDPSKTPRRCAVAITGLPSGYMFFIRIKSVYNTVSAEISGADSGGVARNLVGAQTMVDATGKTTDVYRRIQVRKPTQQYFDLPEYAIETAEDLCKRITVAPGYMADECDPNANPPGGPISPATPPPLPPPPLPPPSPVPTPRTCAFSQVFSKVTNLSWDGFTDPTPPDDALGAIAILSRQFGGPLSAVYLNGIPCNGSYSRARVSISTSGSWTTPPDVIEVLVRRRDNLQRLVPVTNGQCPSIVIPEDFVCVPNLNNATNSYEWVIAGVDPSNLEFVLLMDSDTSHNGAPAEYAWVKSVLLIP